MTRVTASVRFGDIAAICRQVQWSGSAEWEAARSALGVPFSRTHTFD